MKRELKAPLVLAHPPSVRPLNLMKRELKVPKIGLWGRESVVVWNLMKRELKALSRQALRLTAHLLGIS